MQAPRAHITSNLPPDVARQLLQISLQLNAEQSQDDLLHFIISATTDLLDCQAASLLLFDDETQRLHFAAATGSDPAVLKTIPVPIDNSIAGTIFSTGTTVRIDDARNDERHFKDVDNKTAFETRSLIGVPMKIAGTPVGVLEALNKRNNTFSQNDEHILEVIASQAAVAVRNARQITALQEANTRLGELDELKSDILAIASHELRTPLAAILGYGKILREETADDVAEFVEAVIEAGERMQSVTEAMSRMASLRSGSITVDRSELELPAVVSEAMQRTAREVERRGHDIHMNWPEEVPLVLGDHELLTDAVTEILDNAVRFMEDEGTISFSCQMTEETITLRCTDEGVGLPDDAGEAIFEAFHQVEDHLTRSEGGLGLGLTISREIIHLHKGEITAESDGPETGTTVTITLPRRHRR